MNKGTGAARLRGMLSVGGCCPLDDDALKRLLAEYPCIEQAAYHACLMLSQDSSLGLPDGTRTPSQSRYWEKLALSFRPAKSALLARADEKTERSVRS